MEIWISSDLHLFHENIIRYCNRPFANADVMTEALIQYHNERVKPPDHWYHLGDLTMLRGSVNSQQAQRTIAAVKRMNGHKRTLLGNHDHFPPKVYLECGFEKIVGTGQWLDGMILSHYPIHPSSLGRAKACVHGHTHDAPDEPAKITIKEDLSVLVQPYVNVSIERTDYRPLSLDEVKQAVQMRIDRMKGLIDGESLQAGS